MSDRTQQTHAPNAPGDPTRTSSATHHTDVPLRLTLMVSSGRLPAGSLHEAVKMWQTYCKAARAGDRTAAGYSLLLMRRIGDCLAARGRHGAHRLLLEATLRAVPEKSQKVVVRCRLAHAALRQGALADARGWLADLDVGGIDLDSDSELRLAMAAVATASGDFDAVLVTIGRHPGRVPLAITTRLPAALLRANALERRDGILIAAAALLDFVSSEPGTPADHLAVVAADYRFLRLCPQSLPLALAQVQGRGATGGPELPVRRL